MPRTKNQAARRLQVEEAAERALATRGADALRISDVATEAGLSAATVLYYYPTRELLVRVAFRRAFERFVETRRSLVRSIPDPAAALVAALAEGFPTGRDDTEVVTLYTGVQAIRDDRQLAALVRRVTASQVAMYRDLLDAGASAGVFRLAAPADDIAKNLVALEDAYGLYAVGAGFPSGEGLRLTLAFAEMAVGRSLPSIHPTDSPLGEPAKRRG
jgi:AcrR family transcriptional regulator